MTRYLVGRLAAAVPVLLGVSLLAFGMMKLIPGDPARLMAGLDASERDIQNIRQQLGLEEPVWVQYATFVTRAVQGDFGRSIRSRRPVADEIGARLPATAELAAAAMALAVGVGITLGVIAAARQYSIWDNLAMLLALLGISVPIFWLGMMLILLFSVGLGWLPTAGRETGLSLVLPSITLGATSAAMIARMARSSMLEVLGQDYVRTARAKGLLELVVLTRHALKNAMIPTVTLIGLQLGTLVGGAVITETVFAWPGLGRLLVDAVRFRDFPTVQALVLLLALLVLLVNLLVDLVYGILDPRIRYG
ncbi:MAG: ABC transporter permease [Chloroflexi bacterium]|nr:ABC transporter permease [Chloroflexota bacterium]